MEKLKSPFKSLLNRDFDGYKINSGDKKYTWSYLDENGELVEESKDMYEYIQSFKASTNIVERIKKEESEEGGKGLYMDVTKLGSDFDSINQYFGGLVSEFKKAFAEGQRVSNSKEIGQGSAQDEEVDNESGKNDNQGGTE